MNPKDAQVILHMLKIGATQTYCDPVRAGINDIQELSKTHEVISKAKTELWHRLLTHYLPLALRSLASPATPEAIGSSRFSSSFQRPPASRPTPRKPSSKRRGASFARKYRKHGYWAISTRLHKHDRTSG